MMMTKDLLLSVCFGMMLLFLALSNTVLAQNSQVVFDQNGGPVTLLLNKSSIFSQPHSQYPSLLVSYSVQPKNCTGETGGYIANLRDTTDNPAIHGILVPVDVNSANGFLGSLSGKQLFGYCDIAYLANASYVYHNFTWSFPKFALNLPSSCAVETSIGTLVYSNPVSLPLNTPLSLSVNSYIFMLTIPSSQTYQVNVTVTATQSPPSVDVYSLPNCNMVKQYKCSPGTSCSLDVGVLTSGSYFIKTGLFDSNQASIFVNATEISPSPSPSPSSGASLFVPLCLSLAVVLSTLMAILLVA